MVDTLIPKDNLSNLLLVGDTVHYVHNLWRGRDEIRVGKIISFSKTMANLEVKEVVNGLEKVSIRKAKFSKIGKIH